MADMLGLLDEEGLHWAYWIWRRPYARAWRCNRTYALVCQEGGRNEPYVADSQAISLLDAHMHGLPTHPHAATGVYY